MRAPAGGSDVRDARMQVVATTGLMEAFVTDVIAVRPTTNPNVCCLEAAGAGWRHLCPDSSGLQIARLPCRYHAIERRETIKVQMIEWTQAAATLKRRKMIRFVFPFTRMKSEVRIWLHGATSIGPLQFCCTIFSACRGTAEESGSRIPKRVASRSQGASAYATPDTLISHFDE